MANEEFEYNPIGLSLQEELGPRRTAFLGTSASSTFFLCCVAESLGSLNDPRQIVKDDFKGWIMYFTTV